MRKNETINMNMPAEWVPILEATARRHGVTMSWVCRIIMRNPRKFPIPPCRRPKHLIGNHQKFQVCIYDTKVYWKLLMLAHQSEFGPYLRHLIALYLPFLDELDYEIIRFVKMTREVLVLNGSTFVKPIKIQRFLRASFRPKDAEANIGFMELGISNRGRRRDGS